MDSGNRTAVSIAVIQEFRSSMVDRKLCCDGIIHPTNKLENGTLGMRARVVNRQNVWTTSEAVVHLGGAYPVMQDFFQRVGDIDKPILPRLNLCQAVSRVITGQMLSAKAANSIFSRLERKAKACGLPNVTELPLRSLRACGLSLRKAKAIRNFGLSYRADPAKYKCWPRLAFEDLLAAVSAHWGMSNWTAEMLAIFYFGHSDVFPTADGTIKKAVKYLEQTVINQPFEPNLAKPYRTVLALYLWASVDRGYWASQE
jgi:DNA-3-methyladenine glycosylase II